MIATVIVILTPRKLKFGTGLLCPNRNTLSLVLIGADSDKGTTLWTS